MFSEAICKNLTQSCHGNGLCKPGPVVGNMSTYFCECFLRWSHTGNCSESFHELYKGRDTYYYVIGLIFFSLLVVGFATEIIIEILLKPCSVLWKLNFTFKIISLFTVMTRIFAFGFWAYYSHYGLENHLLIIDQVILALGNVAAFAMYYGEILMWVALVSRLDQISKETTDMFKKARTIILVILVISVPIQLAFSILYATSVYTWATFIYFIEISIVLIGALIWSSIYVVKLHSSLSDLNLKVIQRKNYFLGITNFFIFLYIIANVLFLLLNAKEEYMKYLGLLSFLRFSDAFIALFILLTVENYLLLGKKKLKEKFTEGWKSRTGNTKSNKSAVT
eukprot:TRINITY_DN8240_c0_g1_i1.p1 TRINITY_DN8240_c0_g1~~TRINITY_DN8240_c0_g1_i1.p1  ORF type:complete len:337 (+),score=36.77 TRINITY_DN8240_c0_g1_i1:67-1077(+)